MSGVTGSAGGYGGWYGARRNRLPGARVDYRGLAEDAWLNSIVAASVSWVGRNLGQAKPCVYREDTQGNDELIPRHELAKKLRRPNAFYDGKTLLQATFLSLISGRGNAYWWIRYANDGTVAEFWYIPHFQIWPVWKADATSDTWIAGYQYRQAGKLYFLRNQDVLHFRDGLDPYQLRLGLDPLGSAYRELVGDNESSGYYVSVLKNMGIMPLLISMKDPGVELIDADKKEIKDMIEDATTGDNRGRPAIVDSALEFHEMGLTPEKMLLQTAGMRPESRICALTGINAVVLGLQAGLEHSTYSNMEEARRAAWEDGIVPRLELVNAELTTQVLPAYEGLSGYDAQREEWRVGTDLRQVTALQDSQDAKYKRVFMVVGGPVLTPNEGRQMLDMDEIEGGDKLYPVKGAMPSEAGAEDAAPPTPLAKPDDPASMAKKNGNGNGRAKMIGSFTGSYGK